VALYGDSQTRGDEVGAEEAWGSVLARRLGCRVANYGVGGYGSDQALLRYLERDDGRAAHVVLGHWSENVLRNVNQYRELLYPAPFGLKPRFVLEADGALRHVPIPSPDAAGLARLLSDPAAVLSHEFFLPGTAWGPTPLRFPWSVAVGRATGHFRVRAWLAGHPAYARFYDPDHPSGALPLTAAILERFRDEAQRRGQRATPLLIPTGLDLVDRVRHRRWSYRPLADRLADRGVELLDAGPAILERLPGRDPCALFDDCSAHFNADGNALLAGIVFDHLCGSMPETAPPPFPGCRE
jgi:lysophospholipase L1-like esterase